MKKIFLFTILIFLFNINKNYAEGIEVGTEKTFWVWDLSEMPPGFIQVKATCQAVGEYSYIFVDNNEWNVTVYPEDVSKILETFEEKTPLTSKNPNQGIYENNVESFGTPPDELDNDPKIYILIAYLPPYEKRGETFYFDGYFNAFDEYPDSYAWENYKQHSNEVEMIYINCCSLNPPSSDYMLAVIAHEFAHMIQWNYDKDEESWIGESCSEAAMIINGYYTDEDYVKAFSQNYNVPLVETSYVDYGACLLWGTYLMDIFGIDFLKSLVEVSKNGIEGIEENFKNLSIDMTFSSLFSNWVIANYINNSEIYNGEYGYTSISLPPFQPTYSITKYTSLPRHGTIKNYAVNYIKISEILENGFKFTLNAQTNKNLGISVIKLLNDAPFSIVVEKLENPSNKISYEIPYGTNFTEIIFVLYSYGDNSISYNFKVEPLNGSCGVVTQKLNFSSFLIIIIINILVLFPILQIY